MIIIQNLSYFLIGSGVFAFLIRSLFKIFIDKDIEKYKFDLRKENFKFNQLHQKRADVIIQLYQYLVSFEQEMISFIRPFQAAGEEKQEEKGIKTQKAGNDFFTYVIQNRIFFDERTCEILDSIIKETQTIWGDFTIFPVYKHSEFIDGKERMEKWNKCWTKMEKDIPILKKKLEKNFKDMLGVE